MGKNRKKNRNRRRIAAPQDQNTAVQNTTSSSSNNNSTNSTTNYNYFNYNQQKQHQFDDKALEGPAYARFKELGNRQYIKHNYRAAVAEYTAAIDSAKQALKQLLEEQDSNNNNNNDNDDQVNELRKLVASYYGNRSAAYAMLQEHLATIEDSNAALDCDPSSVKIHVRRAKACVVLGQLDEALMSYQMALLHSTTTPDDPTLVQEHKSIQTIKDYYTKAKQFVENHNGPRRPKHIAASTALFYITSVSNSSTEWGEATILHMEILLAGGNVEKALDMSNNLLSNKKPISTTGVFLLVRAKCFCAKGYLDAAVKNLRQAVSRCSNRSSGNGGSSNLAAASALLTSCMALSKKKTQAETMNQARDYVGAVATYTEAIDCCSLLRTTIQLPNSFLSKLYYNRARSNASNPTACIEDCSKAIELDNSYADVYVCRAESYLTMGEEHHCELAIRDLEMAEDLADTHSQARSIAAKLQSARIQLRRAKQKDLYKVLGVPRNASDTQIRKSYRQLALKYHPDRQKSHVSAEEKQIAEATFREINSAHEILSDPEKRRRYDAGVAIQDLDNPHARPDMYDDDDDDGIDLEDLMFHMFMHQHLYARHGASRGRSRGGGGGFSFSGSFY
eukprot:CAMPEP_0172425696 /NCGR_PEP_ID=MMETSP1064-20121228/33528_1 /TAXON_ID=202472 /ORGANISM="Aulacoseira subarctica , Strain CCAP 1002/5" /LENGTH=619 /DNA_ID=CAMNT_0013168797 /DNA_START=133 /DNA_END=1992 /DNA_ORIENTATION=-